MRCSRLDRRLGHASCKDGWYLLECPFHDSSINISQSKPRPVCEQMDDISSFPKRNCYSQRWCNSSREDTPTLRLWIGTNHKRSLLISAGAYRPYIPSDHGINRSYSRQRGGTAFHSSLGVSRASLVYQNCALPALRACVGMQFWCFVRMREHGGYRLVIFASHQVPWRFANRHQFQSAPRYQTATCGSL